MKLPEVSLGLLFALCVFSRDAVLPPNSVAKKRQDMIQMF